MPHRKRPFVEHRGTTIRVRWPGSDGKLRSASHDDSGRPFADDAEAERYGWEQMGQIARGQWHDPRNGDITLEEWINKLWWPAQDLGLRTQENYRWYIEAFLLPAFGGGALSDLATLEIGSWERSIHVRGYARRVARDARSLLITILGDAVNHGLIPTNPAVRLPGNRGRRSGRRRPRSKKQWATPLEVLLVAERTALLTGRDD